MEENNNDEKTILDKGKEVAKQGVKNLASKGLKKLIPVILPAIGWFFLILLAVGIINLIPYLINQMFTSLFSGLFGGSSASEESGTASSAVTESVVYIDEDGKYNLKVEDLADQILAELESQKVDTAEMGLNTDEFGDMIDKYIEAEVKTTLPKTGKSDLDGIIVIKRASTSTGSVIDLKYTSYEDFKSKVNTNPTESLQWFSINPDNFKLCISRKTSFTIYKDANGAEIRREGEGKSIVIEEIDYQSYVQNYAAPLNFFLTLHVISQDIGFMQDVLDMVLGEGDTEPIVLTYIDSEQQYKTKYQYSGRYYEDLEFKEVGYTYSEDSIVTSIYEKNLTDEYIAKVDGDTVDVTITNPNVNNYIDEDVEYFEIVSTTYTGSLQLTKANTWLKSSNKTINSMTNTPEEEISAQEENLVNINVGPRIYVILDDESHTTRLLEERKIHKVDRKITTTFSSKNYTVVDTENQIIVDDFVALIESYPKVRNNFETAPSNTFYLLQQNENTQKLEKIMRYVIYKLNDIDYGVTEGDLEWLLTDRVASVGGISNLAEYLLQFSHGSGEYQAPQSSDGKYYKMYGDGVGWPTIGNADLQWKSHHTKFNKPGKIMHNGAEKEVASVSEYVNSILPDGPKAKYSNAEVAAWNIYIEKELVDSVGDAVQLATYNDVVENDLFGLNLTRQQIYPLVAIQYNFGHLPIRNNKTFKQVYVDGRELYEEGSWQHNRYIWDNWWCRLGGGAAGHIPSRDAAYETYIKGVFDYTLSDAGEVFGRKYYIYYTASQLANFSYAPKKTITRTTANEEEIFTMVQNNGTFERDNTDSRVLGYYTSTMGRRFTILNQTRIADPYNGTVVDWGDKCNRAAAAIIASGYSDKNATELIYDMNDKYEGGSVPNDKYWNEYGLKLDSDTRFNPETNGSATESGYVSKLREQLASGGYAMIWIKESESETNQTYYQGESGMKWTKLYHWMAIIDYKVNSDGTEQMCIADWHGAEWYNLTEFRKGITRMALISEK